MIKATQKANSNQRSTMRQTAVVLVLLCALQASLGLPLSNLLTSGSSNEITPQGSTNCSTCQWPKSGNGIVYIAYTLASDYLSVQETMMAQWLQEISTLTCVNFVQRTTETNYLDFQSHGGCWAYIGNVGGAQGIGVDMQYCMFQYIFQHEVLHALGFNHEVQRKDRDQYVQILYNNIMPGQQGMFDIIYNYVPVLSYDYNSVMHYDSNEYSQYGANTIVPIPNPNVPVGQNVGVSPMDIVKVNALYQCNLCRKLFNGDSGNITSADYPSPYPSNSSCLYLIRVPANKILLEFQALDIEGSTNCSSDYLRVYDGLNTSSPVLLDKTCGNKLPNPLMSSSRYMLFEFVSNGAVSGAGFQASYSTVLCGGIYTQNNGIVTSPNYPAFYSPNLNCFYRIIAPQGYKITVTFDLVFLFTVPNCDASGPILKMYDGSDSTAPLLTRFCSINLYPPVVTSTGNNMVLKFITDNSLPYPGFSLTYSFVPIVS